MASVSKKKGRLKRRPRMLFAIWLFSVLSVFAQEQLKSVVDQQPAASAAPIGGRASRSLTKGGATSSRQPDQRAATEQCQLLVRALQPNAGCVEHSAGHSCQAQRKLESDCANHSAAGLATLYQPEYRW